MSIAVNIQGATFNIPTQGTTPPWGDDVVALLQALVNVANSSVGSADILTTNFALTNNQASATNVVGLSFDTSQVRSAIVSYSIYISTNSNELSECGNIYLTYKSASNTWELAQNYAGTSGVIFSITTAGQVQYTSSNVSGTSYLGKMKFSAKAFLQT